MLIFDNYAKENMPVKRANYSELKYLKKPLARVYRKEDYSDYIIPKIVTKLSIKSVMKLLGLQVQKTCLEKGKDKEECLQHILHKRKQKSLDYIQVLFCLGYFDVN